MYIMHDLHTHKTHGVWHYTENCMTIIDEIISWLLIMDFVYSLPQTNKCRVGMLSCIPSRVELVDISNKVHDNKHDITLSPTEILIYHNSK